MDFGSPKGKLKAKLGRMGPRLGARKLGAMLTILEPGKARLYSAGPDGDPRKARLNRLIGDAGNADLFAGEE